MKEPTTKESAAMAVVKAVRFEAIPNELVMLHQWLVWRYEENDRGELKKPPFTPRSGKRADVTNPETWGSFEEAYEAYTSGRWAGIGLALVSGIVAIDIDHCYKENQLHPRAEAVIRSLHTYVEESPGEGARGFFKGTLPASRRRRGNYELYEDGRYVTVTGRHIAFTPSTISSSQERLNKFYQYIFPEKKEGQQSRRVNIQRNVDTPDIIKKALAAKNGESFRRYLNGDCSLWGEAGKHKSKSDADFQFCLMLAYWTNGDTGKMDAIFRSSGLYDAKWDERRGNTTYGAWTLEKALQKATSK